jgi:polyphenol oxidase
MEGVPDVRAVIEVSTIGRIAVPPHVPRGFALFYTTRDFDGRLDADVARGLAGFLLDRFGIRATLNTCTQVHGARVQRAAGENRWRECDACDALFSAENGTALGIKVADCLPVTMIDSAHSVIANVHSGWRGAVQQITAVTLDTLAAETRFDPSVARAWLGPSIRVCCFEVGDEVAMQFDPRYVERARGAKPHVDLAAFTKDILKSRGFDDDRIVDTELCTRCDGSLFHSFRRDGSGGRNLAIVAQ